MSALEEFRAEFDKGPWRAIVHDHKVYVGSDDFTHDVWLHITGDMSTELAFNYAKKLAEVLNATQQPGFALVPIEPTQAMLDAELGLRHWDNLPSYEQRRDLRPHIWKAMVRAANHEVRGE